MPTDGKIKVMKVFFDARFIRVDHHDGISRYSYSLLQAFAKIHPVTAIIHDPRQIEKLPRHMEYVFLNAPTSIKELFIARKLNDLGADVVFSPMQLMGSRKRRYHLILTLHDLIYYEHKTPPTNLALPVRFIWWLFHSIGYWPQRFLLNRADLAVTVSETTKELMREHWLTKRPIKVAYNAPSNLSKVNVQQGRIEKNLVYMGSFMPYKNVETILQALYFLPDYKLHALSTISDSRKAELLKLAPPNQVVFHNGVSDEEYNKILGSAHALVTASESEGFGLPVIEAMRAGVPVVCSDIPIFHEVAGKCALFFEPDNQTKFSKQVVKLENNKFRETLIKHAKKQSETFNWEDSAKELLEAMQFLND